MSSAASYIKQIPLNNGYFRSISGATGATTDASHIYNLTFSATDGTFSSASLASTTATPPYYIGLLRDLGAEYYDAATDRVFRRVQVVSSTGRVTGAAGTVDSSYGVYYIIVGRRGAATGTATTLDIPSPFVRTG